MTSKQWFRIKTIAYAATAVASGTIAYWRLSGTGPDRDRVLVAGILISVAISQIAEFVGSRTFHHELLKELEWQQLERQIMRHRCDRHDDSTH